MRLTWEKLFTSLYVGMGVCSFSGILTGQVYDPLLAAAITGLCAAIVTFRIM